MNGSPTDHFDGRRFFNPAGANGRSFRDVPRMLATARTRWPKRIPVQPQQPPPLQTPDDVVVTFVGHSTFLIQTSAGNILTDPMYSEHAGPLAFLGPRRVREPGVHFDDLPAISAVLLSHNHYDHCDLRTLSRLEKRHGPVVITPLGNAPLVRSTGARRIEELDWWQESTTAPLPVTVTPAQHFSARGPFDRNEALWGGFVFSVGGRRIFFAGDSGYASHLREVRERLGPIDLALIPIGAYEPRWFMKDIHMNPAEAVQAHLDLGARQSIAMHFGTFQLTPEGVAEPVVRLAEELEKRDVAGARFRVLEFGESVRLPATASRDRVADSPS
jgi:L-ascorbate metabolism protein UlaG (beta-lactamase superfamily)